MSIVFSAEYKGYLISWNDCGRAFDISFDGKEVKRKVQTAEDCEKWIDAKTKQRFKRIPIIFKAGWGARRVKGEATSAIDEKYVWAVSEAGERSKIEAKDAWLATAENVNALDIILSIDAEIERLIKEKKGIIDGTARLTTAMMIDEATP